jgi:hypothetical protein
MLGAFNLTGDLLGDFDGLLVVGDLLGFLDGFDVNRVVGDCVGWGVKT